MTWQYTRNIQVRAVYKKSYFPTYGNAKGEEDAGARGRALVRARRGNAGARARERRGGAGGLAFALEQVEQLLFEQIGRAHV